MFWSELEKVNSVVQVAVEACNLTNKVLIFYLNDIVGNDELFPTETNPGDLWDCRDAVHLSQIGYQGVAEALYAMASGADEGEPAAKRIRLDSIVPTAPKRVPAARQNVVLPAWLTGASGQGTGRGRAYRGGRGGRGAFFRGRGRGVGDNAPPRGSARRSYRAWRPRRF